jgi:hypothetical protein
MMPKQKNISTLVVVALTESIQRSRAGNDDAPVSV